MSIKAVKQLLVVPEHQADATLAQANPVQNTWYTILDTTKMCRIIRVLVGVADTGETLQCRITVDGNVRTMEVAANANAAYLYYLGINTFAAETDTSEAGLGGGYTSAFLLEGRSVKVEMRKTTAAGVGNLNGKAIYALW